MRIFLDANVLFPAAKSAGAVRRLLAMLREDGHECWADGYVITEARRNLELKQPGGVGELDRLLEQVEIAPVQPPKPVLEETLSLPEKNFLVLAAAIRLGCQALVTGDRTHFGALYGRTVRGVAIHSPRSLAVELWGVDER